MAAVVLADSDAWIIDPARNGARYRVNLAFPVDAASVGVCGWSLSGLFAAYAWRTRFDMFSRLLAISPSLWWSEARMVSAGR